MDVSLNIGMLAASYVDVPTSALEGTIAGLALAVALCAVQAVQRMLAKRNGSEQHIECPNKIHELPGVIQQIGSHVRRVKEVVDRIEKDHEAGPDGIQTWKTQPETRHTWLKIDHQQGQIIHSLEDVIRELSSLNGTIKGVLISSHRDLMQAIGNAGGEKNRKDKPH